MPGIKLLGGADFQSAKATNLADPSAASDAATKNYVDNSLAGLAWKQPVSAATTTNGTLTTAYANTQVIDGVTLTTGMRILLKNQTTGTENGIYVVQATGSPVRATDSATTVQLQSATVYVISGTVNKDTAYTQTADSPVVGTTAIVFAQVGGGNVYTASSGLQLIGSAFSVLAGSGIIADGASTRIDPAYAGLAKRFAADCVATTNPQTFTHALVTSDVDITVRIKATGEVVQAVVGVSDANNITVDFGGAPTAAQYRVVVTA